MMDYGALQAEFAQHAVRVAHQTAGNRIGKVAAVSLAGGYDVQYSDGSSSRNVSSQKAARWKIGDWVTIEMASGRPVIVDIATGAAGA